MATTSRRFATRPCNENKPEVTGRVVARAGRRGAQEDAVATAFASHCYANGMDLLVFKRLLGHSQLSTTVIYVDCSWDQCQTSHP